jgi:hypothetical protein
LHTSKACPQATNQQKKKKKELSSLPTDLDPDTLLAGQGDDLAGIEDTWPATGTTMPKDATGDNKQKLHKKKRRVVKF